MSNGLPPTRTLRDYLASLPVGSGAGVVDQNLVIRTDLATMGQAVPLGGTTGQVLSKLSDDNLDIAWVAAGAGDMQKIVYDPQDIEGDAFDLANMTGFLPNAQVSGLGSAALESSSAFATAAQGVKADTAVQPTATQTMTNKRINPRMVSVASTATLTLDVSVQDIAAVTAQAGALTIAAPTGSPVDGQTLTIRLRDNGTARAITWNAIYAAFTPADLRTTTVVGKTLLLQFMYNSTETKWQLLHSNASFGLWS